MHTLLQKRLCILENVYVRLFIVVSLPGVRCPYYSVKGGLLLISVIVPMYNVARYLEKGIESLENQQGIDLEIVLVNDGSTDNTLEIASSLRNKYANITVINKKNGGVSSARNEGLKNANGEYIYFFDPDDYLANENYLSDLAQALRENDMSISDFEYVYETGETEYDTSGKKLVKVFEKRSYDEIISFLLGDFQCTVWRVMLRNDIIKKNKLLFNENISLSEDLLFMIYYMRHCKHIRYSENNGYCYRKNNNTATSIGYKKNLVTCRVEFIKEIKIILSECGAQKSNAWNIVSRLASIFSKEIIYNEYSFSDAPFSDSISNVLFEKNLLTWNSILFATVYESPKTMLLLLLKKFHMGKIINYLYKNRNRVN